MARTRTVKKQLTLPAAIPEQAKKDVKTIAGIFNRWGSETEGLVKDIFGWGKKHKFLVITIGALLLVGRWMFAEEESRQNGEEAEYE